MAVFGVALPATLALSELACRIVFGSVFPRAPLRADASAFAPDASYDRLSTKRRICDELGSPELLDYLLPQDMPMGAGSRGHQPPGDLARGGDVRPRVLIIGDSVAEGAGVAASETFAARLAERMPGYRFINIAQGGLNIYQIYAKFMIHHGAIAPAMVVYVACSNDPFPDIWLERLRNPLELPYLYKLDPRTGFPVLSAPVRWLLARDSLHSALVRLLIIYGPLLAPSTWGRGPQDFDFLFRRPYALLVGALEKACRLDGVPFLVVEVHPPGRPRIKDFLDILASGVQEKRNLHVFEMARDLFMGDIHLNARGHEKLSRLLMPVLSGARRRPPA